MPLYIAEIRNVVVFVAEDAVQARIEAEDYAREEVGMNGAECDVRPATRRNVPRDWYNCLPYGTDNETKVGEILDAMEKAPATPAELEAAGQQRLAD